MPQKDNQTIAKEAVDRYKDRVEKDKQPKQGQTIDLTQPQFAYKLQPSSRFYADLELSIVFKESNAKLYGRRLFQFTDRVWIYATNAHVRAMCANLNRVVFKAHVGSVTDVVLPQLDVTKVVVVGSSDVNKKICVWSVNDRLDIPTVTTHVNFDLPGSAYGIYLNFVATSITLKAFVLLSNGQVNLFDMQPDVWNLVDAPALGVLSVVMESCTLPREVCVTDSLLVASTGDRITGVPINKSKNPVFEIQTTSKSGQVTFLHVLSPTTIVVATMTSLQLWSLSPEPFLSQVIQVDLRNYRLKGFSPSGSGNQKLWCVVGCPLDWSTSSMPAPLLCFHLSPSGPRFVIDYVSEFELVGPVVAFQVMPSASSSSGVDVYVMHSNYLVLMKLGPRAILDVPRPSVPSKNLPDPPKTEERVPGPYHSQGATAAALPHQTSTVPETAAAKPAQQPQPPARSAVPAVNLSGSYEEKIARLKMVLSLQQEQIASLADQVAAQTETVRALTAELTNGPKIPASLEGYLVKIEKKITDLRAKVAQADASVEGSRLQKLADDVCSILSTNVPKIIHDALIKVCTKEQTPKLPSGMQQQIVNDIMAVSKGAIAAAVNDATQDLLRTVGQETAGLGVELERWRKDIQSSLQQTAQTIATAQVAAPGGGQAAPAELTFSPEIAAQMVQRREFSECIRLTLRTKKYEDLQNVLLLISQVSHGDIEHVVNSGEISLDAVVGILTALSSNLKDPATIDYRLEWIEAIGMSDAFLNKQPEAKAAWQLCGERLQEVRAFEGYSSKVLRTIKVALNMFITSEAREKSQSQERK